MIYKGFEPVYNNKSRILILGSFPSIISRRDEFYYAHPSNRFWRVIGEIYKCNLYDLKKDSKIEFLLTNNLALWDIVYKCNVKNSSDSEIKVNEIGNLVKILEMAAIEKILCNGRLAYNLTIKHYGHMDIPIIYLPSTSSANRCFDISLWSRQFK